MKYVILCGGHYTKWQIPRQMLRIGNETIVGRTIRLLHENGITNIAISSNNSDFQVFGLPLIRHQNMYRCVEYNNVLAGTWVDAFYPTAEPTTYLFGDVVYSRDAIKTIIDTTTSDVAFFGSAPPFAHEYLKNYEEPFCFKVVNTTHFRKAVHDVKMLEALGKFNRKPIAWELWNVILRGVDGDVNTIDFNSYIHINDFTCDIDTPAEAVANIKKLTEIINEKEGDTNGENTLEEVNKP